MIDHSIDKCILFCCLFIYQTTQDRGLTFDCSITSFVFVWVDLELNSTLLDFDAPPIASKLTSSPQDRVVEWFLNLTIEFVYCQQSDCVANRFNAVLVRKGFHMEKICNVFVHLFQVESLNKSDNNALVIENLGPIRSWVSLVIAQTMSDTFNRYRCITLIMQKSGVWT